MKKLFGKVLALALCLALVLGLAACGGDDETKTTPDAGAQTSDTGSQTSNGTGDAGASIGEQLAGTYDITVWVSESDGVKELTEQQIAKFCQDNPGIVINATVEGVGEGEAATQMISSVEDGADLFCFAQDQLARLVMAGALNKLGVKTAETITSINDAGSVAAASVGGELYCYPLTSDNGYFMFYDKSVIDESEIDDLAKLVAKCEQNGKMFSFQLEGSAWYNAGFFFATGCHSEWETDTDGNFLSVNDDFNSDAGVTALKGMQILLKSSCYNNSASAADFAAAVPSAVVISGTWDSSAAKEALGDNYAVADLPSFTVDGKEYHIGSFSGNKLMGVKPQVDAMKAAVLQQLAIYLSGEECQLQRFQNFGWGPSNKNAQGNTAVQEDAALAALASQSAYAIPQGQIHGSWWDIAKVYATSAKEANTDAELKSALQTYQDTISGLFAMTTDEKEAFSVIGAFEGTNWDTDYPMVQKPEGTFYSDAIAFKAGDEFKVRQGASWDVNFGKDGVRDGDNIKIEEDGFYFVKVVFNKADVTAEVSLEKSNPNVGYTVIGDINGDGWTIDLPMEIQPDGSWISTEAYAMDGNEFKVRQGLSWDAAYPADNFKVETAGTYFIKLNADLTVELIGQ